MNLNLIGPRGVGKSNVARRLSVLTKRPVLATDVLISYETGLSIPQLVDSQGWQGFRDLEGRILTRLAALDELIVDCGGGVIVDVDDDGEERYSDEKVATLKAGGPIVWLRGDLERLAAKTAADPDRPALHQTATALEVMQRREPWYARAADWSIAVQPGQRQQAAEAIGRRYWPERFPVD